MPNTDDDILRLLEAAKSESEKRKIVEMYAIRIRAEADKKSKRRRKKGGKKDKLSDGWAKPRNPVEYDPVLNDPFPKILDEEEVARFRVTEKVEPFCLDKPVGELRESSEMESPIQHRDPGWGNVLLPCPFCEEVHSEYEQVVIRGTKVRCLRCGYTATLRTAPCGCIGLEQYEEADCIIHNSRKLILRGTGSGYCIVDRHVPSGMGIPRYWYVDHECPDNKNCVLPTHLTKPMFYAPPNSSRRNLRGQVVDLFSSPRAHSNIFE